MRTLLAFALASACYGQTLAISSAVVAADGHSWTLTMNAGSLTPTSGINTACFTTGGGDTNAVGAVSSIAASGSTVTLTSGTSNARYNVGDSPTITMTTSPTCNLSSGGTNTPVGQTNFAATNNTEWRQCGGSAMSTYTRYEGSPVIGDPQGTGFSNGCWWNSAGGSISVNATGTGVEVIAFDYFTGYKAYVNGSAQSYVPGSTTTTWTDYPLATGQTGTNLYRLVNANSSINWQSVIIAQVRFPGGAPTGTKPPGTLPVIEIIGDSIANISGGGSAPSDMTDFAWFMAATASGTALQGYSLSGADVSPTIASQSPAKLLLYGGAAPAIIVDQGGANDAHGGVTIGTPTTPNTFEGDLYSEIANAPATGIHLLPSILPNSYSGSTSSYRAAQAAVAAYATANGHPSCYFDTTAWISPTPNTGSCAQPNGSGYPNDTCDGVHPNNSPSFPDAHASGKIANLVAPIFFGNISGQSSYSITGPSSGGVGVPVTFTVTLAGNLGSQFVASPAETISLSDGSAGGAFASTYGSGTSTVTFTPTTGGSFTFTYTPANSGSVNLTPTNAQNCWTDPTPIGFVAGTPTSHYRSGGTYLGGGAVTQ